MPDPSRDPRPLADIVAELEKQRAASLTRHGNCRSYCNALAEHAPRLIAAAKALETARAKLTDPSLYECDQIEQALAVIIAALEGR